MPIRLLTESQTPHKTLLIDIVAVHDILTCIKHTSRYPRLNFFWLHKVFPHQRYPCRVLEYEYDTEQLVTFAKIDDASLTHLAVTLLKELTSRRQREDVSSRPIVFVCHGVGGLVVKRALSFAFSPTSDAIQHSRSISNATHGIIFAATPHHGLQREAVDALHCVRTLCPNEFMIDILVGSTLVTAVAEEFACIGKYFKVHNFWAQLKTSLGMVNTYVVAKESAAPDCSDFTQDGIMSTHFDLLNFRDAHDSGYALVHRKLVQYIKQALDINNFDDQEVGNANLLKIPHQPFRPRGHSFDQNSISGGRVHFGDVYHVQNVEDSKVSLHGSPSFASYAVESESIICNEHYRVPRCSTSQFTGRQSLVATVLESFRKATPGNIEGRPKVIVIHGLGGSGKTQFCLRYAETNRSLYWGVFWIDVSTRDNAETGFASLGEISGKGSLPSAGKYWLTQCTRPWLLILDNADDPELDISELIPAASNGHVLITTRNRNITLHANAGVFRFEGMDPDDAINLLLKSAYPHESLAKTKQEKEGIASRIAMELGYLAIALDQAGATIRRKICSIERYLHFYLGCRYQLLTSPKSVSTDETNAITTWEVPFRRIEKAQSAECLDAVVLVHIFAFLHFDTVSEKIFRASWNCTEENKISRVILPDLLGFESGSNTRSEARLRGAISTLCDYSIIDHDAERETCSMHPVVHRWARTRLSSQTQVNYWLDCTIELLTRCISRHFEASGRDFRRLLLPHIKSSLQILETQNISFPDDREKAAQIERFAQVYAENGLWKSALTLQHRVVDFRRKHLGSRHYDTLKAQRGLSHIYWNLFEVKQALDIQRTVLTSHWWTRPALSDWESISRPEHVDYCTALDDLTQTLWLAGRRDLSKTAGERAVAGLKKRRGFEDPLTLNAIFNLARTYIHLGELARGHDMLRSVLRKRKTLFGPRHPDTLMATNEIGMCLYSQGVRLNIAELLVKNVFVARKQILGEEHAYTLWSANDLSLVMCKRGRFMEAVRILEDMIPVVSRTLGDEHIGMSMTKANLARAYVACKRWHDAKATLQQLLSLINENHPNWTQTMSGYVQVQMALDQMEGARHNCEAMLRAVLTSKTMTSSDPRMVLIVKLLAKIYVNTGRQQQVPGLRVYYPALDETSLGKLTEPLTQFY